MISFKSKSEINKEGLSSEELSYLEELLEDSEEMNDGDTEFAYSVNAHCLIIRVFDYGRYSFVFPIELSESASPNEAVKLIVEYATREELPTVFEDVPKSQLRIFFENYRHLDIDASDCEGEAFRVKIKTECELLDTPPTIEFEEIRLEEISDSFAEDYARLCRDDGVNEYWGYDYKEDFKDRTDDGFFVEEARREFLSGTALSLAIVVRERFVGEVILYAFSGNGSAEYAIRILPEFQGRGIAKRAFEATLCIARNIGLLRLFAFVDKRNAVSLSYLSARMEKVAETAGRMKFSVDLY